jgi:hypothetical protein
VAARILRTVAVVASAIVILGFSLFSVGEARDARRRA